MLIDGFGRVHSSLRISVTDRCNIRCTYCMPADDVEFLERQEILSYEEIERVVEAALSLGVVKFRLTGGEPLVRRDLPILVRRLAEKPQVADLALTTNGMLLAECAAALKAAGLRRINVSLDTLQESTFVRLSRRTGLHRVLEGIAAARDAGFTDIRINAVALAQINGPDLIPLAEFCREQQLHLRFIEFMPLDSDQQWQTDQVITGQALLERLAAVWGPLEPVAADPHQPSRDYRYSDNGVKVGFINSVSEPFCGTCNRLRITADGKLRNCLFGVEEWDARKILRDANAPGEERERLRTLFQQCVGAKKAGHGQDDLKFLRPQRGMYQIGG